MLKKYLADSYCEGSEFWELKWQNAPSDLESLAKSVDRRLVVKMEQYLTKGARILEGGCGSGAYAAYFHTRGYAVSGVEYAERTVENLNRSLPELDVRRGDIFALPFPNDSFDAYYSGGVIEHYESGTGRQIAEAWRVLKPGGVFFVTTPYFNLTRRIAGQIFGDRHKVDLDGRRSFVVENVTKFQIDSPPEGFHFHEYILRASEMRQALTASRFRIVAEMSFGAGWGYWDLAPCRRLAGISRPQRHFLNRAFNLPVRVILYIETCDNLLSRGVSWLIGECLGHMRLYVCVKCPPEDPRREL
jgi:SAM-dependent methyltransferase